MKTAEAKPRATQAKTNAPFFSKESEPGFFGSSMIQNSFFSKPSAHSSSIQAKLNVGHPNDPYEKEADSMADKVVQRLSNTETVQRKSDKQPGQKEPFIRLSPITPFVQSKCDHCDQEEKLHKKEDEEEKTAQSDKLRKKPIFDSNAEPTKDEKEDVQMKCAECENEEKLQKKDQEKKKPEELQRKPIFDSEALKSSEINPNVQLKCAECDKEGKINKKESEEESEHELQTKPIFESVSFTDQHGTDPVQLKCSECEKEEKLQKKDKEEGEGEELQTKSIFDSEAVMTGDPGRNVQLKCAECEKEESLQKKDNSGLKGEEEEKKPGLDIQSKTENNFAREGEHRQIQSKYDFSSSPGVSYLQSKSDQAASTNSISYSNTSNNSIQNANNTSSLQNNITTVQQNEIVQEKPEKEDEEPVQKAPVKEATSTTPEDEDEKNHTIQQKCEECEKEHNLQKKESDSSGDSAGASVESNLASSKGSGSLLPKETRSQMESSFGADFSNVRVHSDSRAVEMSKDLHAQAFTSGSDIYFNQGKFDTGSQSGRHLLAHELTHTLQQGKSTVKRVPDIQKDDKQAALAANDTNALAQTVYDALDGWTTSGDSEAILNAINKKTKTVTDDIVKKTADKASNSVVYVLEWMNSDMVTSDWNAILSHFITVQAYMIEGMIGNKLYDLLWGYTSDADSELIMSTLLGTTKVVGELLDKCMTQLEAKGGYGFEYASEKLFGDMKATDALKLMAHFFISGGDYSKKYAEHWMAYKINALLSGATSIDDSQAIVRNFKAVPDGYKESVLFALDKMCQAAEKKSATELLMTDMQESDYNELKGLMSILPKYDPTYAYKKWGWPKFINFFDYVEGGLESIICGVVGVVLGVLSVITDIIGAIIDIVIAAKDLVGMVVYYASLLTGNPICRESKEKVFAFFKGIGDFFGAPGDAIGKMWDNMLEESKVIEGPFEECKNAIFWTTKIANFLVNLILIIFAGYGAVKLALEGIESLVSLIRAGEFLAKLKQLPEKLLKAIGDLPAAASKAIATRVAKVVEILKNPAKLINTVRDTIVVIKRAANEEEFFTFLRQQASEAAKKNLDAWKAEQKEIWKKHKDFWTKNTTELSTSADAVDEKLVNAADSVVDDPAKAENIASDAEKDAKAVDQEASDVKDDIITTGGEGTSTFDSRLPEAWRDGMPTRPPMLNTIATKLRGMGISDDTLVAIINNVALAKEVDAANFFGDFNRFIINFEARAGRAGFDAIIAGLASDSDASIARMLVARVSNSQVITEIMQSLTLKDIASIRPLFKGADSDFINDLRRIVTRVKGDSKVIITVLQDAANDPEKLNMALDRLGDGLHTPEEIRDSLSLVQKLTKAIEEGRDALAKTIFKGHLELDADGNVIRDAKGKFKVTGLTVDKAGDKASGFFRAQLDMISELLLNGPSGTEIDLNKWGIVKDVLVNNDLPTIVQNDMFGEAWSFTKARQYKNLGFDDVIREIKVKILGLDGLPTGEEARLDAAVIKGNEIDFKEFKGSATATVTDNQQKVYDLMAKGETKRLQPYGPNAEKAFGPDMKKFVAKKVDIERP